MLPIVNLRIFADESQTHAEVNNTRQPFDPVLTLIALNYLLPVIIGNAFPAIAFKIVEAPSGKPQKSNKVFCSFLGLRIQLFTNELDQIAERFAGVEEPCTADSDDLYPWNQRRHQQVFADPILVFIFTIYKKEIESTIFLRKQSIKNSVESIIDFVLGIAI
ncbi:MAG: hypothetical protein A4E66_02706 [Syntrophus sp. PtaB.Bin001]|nr:MAG: hypothetical protein A4E66_02706 [Syntrophus sp. PtaB.Bin001]